jgi:hypothetical protein
MLNPIKHFFMAGAALGALVLAGCLNEADKSGSDEPAHLVVSMGVKDVNNLGKQALGKASAIKLKKLVVTLTSSVGTDAVIRDTLMASDTAGSAFVSNSASAQTVLKEYQVRPLRNWTVQIKTLDINDSVVHVASASVNNVGIGEVRTVPLNLVSKFVVYAAKFTLPDSIGSLSGPGKQKLYIKRFRMTVDGITVADTSRAYFQAATAHLIEFNYVRADTAHSIGLFVYADSLGSWDSNRPIFADTIAVASTDTTYHPQLPWTGPGDSQTSLVINIGAVGLVTLDNTTCTLCVEKRRP